MYDNVFALKKREDFIDNPSVDKQMLANHYLCWTHHNTWSDIRWPSIILHSFCLAGSLKTSAKYFLSSLNIFLLFSLKIGPVKTCDI